MIPVKISGLSASAKSKIKPYLQVCELSGAKLALRREGLIERVGHTFEILWELVLRKSSWPVSEK